MAIKELPSIPLLLFVDGELFEVFSIDDVDELDDEDEFADGDDNDDMAEERLVGETDDFF